ncbi:MAG: DUF167 domain-containing protein [Nitrospiraceae bacterium]|nr:DUF167 domain-containing protein [Nitrospiraceae bacterium]
MKIEIPFEKTAAGVRIKVKVQPRSSGRKIAGLAGDTLKVKLTSPPVEGKANEELIEFMGETLGVRKSAIRIARGGSSKLKLIEISGLEPDALRVEIQNLA